LSGASTVNVSPIYTTTNSGMPQGKGEEKGLVEYISS